MTNIKNKNGDFNKELFSKVESFYSWNRSNNWQLLSNYYNSKTTIFSNVYRSELFEISTDKAIIEGAGFSKLAKRIIRLNVNSDFYKEIISNIEAKHEQEKKNREDIKQYNEKRAAAIIEEANSIIIDEDFKTAIKWASEVTGKDKSDRMASAMKGLISRNGKSQIDSDFWQVLRILKSQIK